MAIDGISRLIAITQLKSNNANEEAMAGAQKQRALIDKQKSLNADQSTFSKLKRGEQQIAAMQVAQRQAAMFDKQKSLNADQRTFAELKRGEQQIAVMELQTKLAAFRSTLSPPAAALLDQWLEWAALHH